MIHKLTRVLALMAATGAVTAPAASAMLPPPDAWTGSAGSAPAPRLEVVRPVQSDGFDFGDAAIGAGATLALLVAAGGGTLAVHRVRRARMLPARVA
jgi:hypothetical protein